MEANYDYCIVELKMLITRMKISIKSPVGFGDKSGVAWFWLMWM